MNVTKYYELEVKEIILSENDWDPQKLMAIVKHDDVDITMEQLNKWVLEVIQEKCYNYSKYQEYKERIISYVRGYTLLDGVIEDAAFRMASMLSGGNY